MGFVEVMDYLDGKLDWMAAGLPTEGKNAGKPTAGSIARHDPPTCELSESLVEVKKRVRAAGWDSCVVINSERVVLGMLGKKELTGDPELSIERAMRSGPSTYRPFVPIGEMAHELVDRDLPIAPVTTSDGRLVGLLKREDALRAYHEGRARRRDDSAAMAS
jgi:predicted transcriptional regulator